LIITVLYFASAGLNIVLISRTESKLQTIAGDLESRFGVQTKVIPADFASPPESVWDAIAAIVCSVPVGLLINSAGVSYDHAGEVAHLSVAHLSASNCPAT